MNRFFEKSYHFLQRIKTSAKQVPKNKKNFNFKVAWAIFKDGVIPPGKTLKYIQTISNYVCEYLEPLVEQYRKESYTPHKQMTTAFDKVPVWCCWWQGEDSMPEIVAMCNKRLRQVLPENAELHMITEKNFREYVELPDYIMTKYEEEKMSITALSDILRVALLSRYGGFWIDSTVFVSGEFPQEFISKDFYAQRMYDPVKCSREACQGRWCGFMMAGSKEHIIFRFLRDAFYMWWRDYDTVIDYVILDYFLLAAYYSLDSVKSIIDSLPDNNEDVFEMYRVLHYPYTDELWDKLTYRTVMHKLTYKIYLVKKTVDGEKTLYQYLLDTVDNGE